MITEKFIVAENSEKVKIYGICGVCGGNEYRFDDISVDRRNAEIVDKMLSSAEIPEHLVERIAAAVTGILTEPDIR
ncbi:MAG: hypothetical protein LUG85_02150 [Clostridiales bacterium]|nr:hypothetical protein [Clostridiales bacterium]